MVDVEQFQPPQTVQTIPLYPFHSWSPRHSSISMPTWGQYQLSLPPVTRCVRMSLVTKPLTNDSANEIQGKLASLRSVFRLQFKPFYNSAPCSGNANYARFNDGFVSDVLIPGLEREEGIPKRAKTPGLRDRQVLRVCCALRVESFLRNIELIFTTSSYDSLPLGSRCCI